MKKFIFFFRGGNLAEEDLGMWSVWVRDLQEKGSFVDGAPLIRDGVKISEEGNKIDPFIFDQNENASGFLIIQAANLDEAISLSKDCPVFKYAGNITIRPIIENYL